MFPNDCREMDGPDGHSDPMPLELNTIDAEDPEISDYNMIPDTALMGESIRTCLQESDEVPADFTRLFKTRQGDMMPPLGNISSL